MHLLSVLYAIILYKCGERKTFIERGRTPLSNVKGKQKTRNNHSSNHY